MGNRVHVVKRMPKYGDTEAFNWKAEEFANFLGACNADVCTCREYDYSEFEVEKEKYENALSLVKSLKDANGDNEKMKAIFEKYEVDGEHILECLNELETTFGNVCEIMEAFYQERDKKSGWIAFASF